MSTLQDLLDTDLSENDIRIHVEHIYTDLFPRDTRHLQPRLRTPKNAIKSLGDVYTLFRKAIEHYEVRGNVPTENRVTFTEKHPDKEFNSEIISVSCLKRKPGAFGKGAPFEAKVTNQRPIFREEVDDDDNPGYKKLYLGYWHDNLIRLTCWARTNKSANSRADWLETMMNEYSWWFAVEGVSRVLFWGRDEDLVINIDGNKWYGRPLDYFVRTETIRILSEKEIERILIKLSLSAV